ncbi:hypothetical protein HL667_00245 [Bradyrhizobium sp. 83012]|uniref:Bll5524 protein n=1 Tax=Bradyrhizobium aeschynomenes TaxID=2734909 RepID=A0ABX2C7C1_9BRAD|nr:hypothetical protein [Bradyrhizobium aeschynomenes]NPU10258.1 hypothetical protein [Bradyrhizobium aeschynomenes]NPU63425.1 hypothetical protein [Bradyrhizobium aeschynomenes]NPV19572.1 hypothetical protein [Bradyrhizobium aeschynomenes]
MQVKLLRSRGLRWMLLGVGALAVVLGGTVSIMSNSARAGGALEERKLPMRFSWVACEPNCGWISAVGIVTGDSPKDFEEFARDRDLTGATLVLDSSGGSVNDAITLGRRFRALKMRTTVGMTQRPSRANERPRIVPEAYCESMCVFLLLAGTTRYVPDTAHVRVHQIWMGDRADDAKAASYSAQDLMIVERDIGRLAKYTFDMGGAGDLLLLALNVPPWEDLHELSRAELRTTNVMTTELLADVLPAKGTTPVAELAPKVQDKARDKQQDRFPVALDKQLSRTAEALPTATVAATPQQ